MRRPALWYGPCSSSVGRTGPVRLCIGEPTAVSLKIIGTTASISIAISFAVAVDVFFAVNFCDRAVAIHLELQMAINRYRGLDGGLGSGLGKYREIVLAVAFFLVFDLAVLVLNFYISYQISESAVSINLAGRQRMLSQRMTKAVLIAQSDSRDDLPTEKTLAELEKTVSLFDATLNAFAQGGSVIGGDNQPASLQAVHTDRARDILQRAQTLWAPYKTALMAVIDGGSAHIDPQVLAAAILYARAHNVELLGLMNDLTTHLEQEANARADTLRQVQTGGIVLALLNFLFILFKFLRRLEANDRKIEAAQKETAEILDTVKEGLFLLDAEFRIGLQYSASLQTMLGAGVRAGCNFREILRELVAPSLFDSACDYIELLLAGRVKESLVAELNPLNAVEVATPRRDGTASRRYLTLQFSRAYVDGKISHLLVTVFDVTVQIELEQALAEARQKAKADVEVMLDLLKVNPQQLRDFLREAEQALLEINEHLRNAGGDRDYRNTINLIFRKIHALKGEAAAIGLQMFEQLAHEFEVLLSGLRSRGAVTGQDLLALPLPLDEFLHRIGAVRDLAAQLATYNSQSAPATVLAPAATNTLGDNLHHLAQRIAEAQGKRINLVCDLALLEQLPNPTRKDIYDIALQLLRNAIVHGIEAAPDRLRREKPPIGSIYLGVRAGASGGYELVLRDDGIGLDPQRIRTALRESGRYEAAEIDAMDDRKIVLQIFEAGFSTAEKLSVDAGHGVGMDVVRQKIQTLGAQLRIVSRRHLFTQFSIRFAA
jgi:HPt (histidine-containing phosphotransfer) domain-containing protein